ncbi:DUF488 domain-containing protein [Embleya sp. NBC_00896]|uniref:DUF488 domain-containing protein n=1 Tax=Embleya sp. NBC_00896 TaxID=2975961 RepID=UPI003868B9D0|nr:DUF488 family protein [Embleya sp. NBC_00896]
MAEPTFTVRRVYDPARPDDGLRVLVDRLWPRGIRKEDALLDDWAKDLTPSGDLRRAWHAGGLAEDVFRARYRDELDTEEARAARAGLLARAGDGRVTLLTAVRDPDHSHVPVLLDFLRESP